MSASGPKRTSLVALHMSAFEGTADMLLGLLCQSRQVGLTPTREDDPLFFWERPTCARVESVTGNGTLKGGPCDGKPKRAWALRR